jgi:hypothetical protein
VIPSDRTAIAINRCESVCALILIAGGNTDRLLKVAGAAAGAGAGAGAVAGAGAAGS